MAAFDDSWLGSMSRSYDSSDSPAPSYDPNPPTVAAFAPTSTSGYSATAKQRSTVIVHKKSPLLVATPPQITRTLAHSHPFILPLNKLAGLLSWSTDDTWESFLLVAAFWGVCLYGDEVVRYATPINGVIFLILGMYSRRYSPLSSTSSTGEKRNTSAPQHKSLDEIVETMTQFTARCNILLDPFLNMTDFLSTQRTATSATTRPALTTLLVRIILVTPLWILLTLPPLYILTPQRVIISIGTIILTWHSRPAKVSRVILWRSVIVRRISAFITGLDFDTHPDSTSLIRKGISHQHANAAVKGKRRNRNSSGVRFTFVLYENQRRWIGLGWTTSMFAYERGSWTDEHLNLAPSKDGFELPSVDGGQARWRWISGSKWQIEEMSRPGKNKRKEKEAKKTDENDDDEGWVYYDNKWNDGRLEDGWGRYTRRRKWFRDAELVEITASTETSPANSDDEAAEKVRRAKEFGKTLSAGAEQDLGDSIATLVPDTVATPSKATATGKEDDANAKSTKRRSGWFTRGHSYNKSTDSTPGTPERGGKRDSSTSTSLKSKAFSDISSHSRDGPEQDVLDRWRDTANHDKNLGVGEDVYMGLG